MSEVLSWTLHVAVALVAAPLQLGVINKTKASFAGRVGPPVLQPYYDLIKLARKDSVFSTTTTWVFRAGPVVSLVTAIFAVLLVPLGSATTPISFTGDLVLLAYLFALGRFFTVTAALDTGSAFEGMGAAREVTFACFAEPAFFLGMLVLAKLSGSLQLERCQCFCRPGSLELVHRAIGRELSHSVRRSQYAPGIDHDSRSHGARPQRAGAEHDPVRGRSQAVRVRRTDSASGNAVFRLPGARLGRVFGGSRTCVGDRRRCGVSHGPSSPGARSDVTCGGLPAFGLWCDSGNEMSTWRS
jgi:hypothetical protein